MVTRHRHRVRALAVSLACVALCCTQCLADGSLREVNGYLLLTVEGSPAEMGRQHGELLGETVRRVIQDVVIEGEGGWDLDGLLAGAMVMERHLPPAIREELHALAAAAEVDYQHLVALQLFGDVRRGQMCTGFAAFGPATATGEIICGRNMDYWDHGASEYAAILVHYRPANGYDFLTCSWAGIINGWTTLNERGIVCSNNSAYGAADSLEGLSTCFMVRKVAQFAGSVADGIQIVRDTPRACGTNLFIAGGDPPDAAVVEYDHEQVIARLARDGYVVADNSFVALGRTGYDPEDPPEPSEWSRAGTLAGLIRASYGHIDRTMNFAAAPGVPIRSMNLHSALLFPADRIMYVSMGVSPAADQPYHGFQLTDDGVLGLDLRDDSPQPGAE